MPFFWIHAYLFYKGWGKKRWGWGKKGGAGGRKVGKILKNTLISSVTSEIIIKTNIRENLKYCSNYEFLKLKFEH